MLVCPIYAPLDRFVAELSFFIFEFDLRNKILKSTAHLRTDTIHCIPKLFRFTLHYCFDTTSHTLKLWQHSSQWLYT